MKQQLYFSPLNDYLVDVFDDMLVFFSETHNSYIAITRDEFHKYSDMIFELNMDRERDEVYLYLSTTDYELTEVIDGYNTYNAWNFDLPTTDD